MADVKWIKITTDMFDNRKIKHLRRLPDGNNIVLIWVMLLTLAGRCNSCGMIFLTENIPYTPKMLADELDFEESTVQLALKALEQLGMIQTNAAGFLSVTGWDDHQNIEGMEKIRESKRLAQARWRAKRKELPSTVDSTVDSTRYLVDHAEEDKERDKEEKEELVHSISVSQSITDNADDLIDRLTDGRADLRDDFVEATKMAVADMLKAPYTTVEGTKIPLAAVRQRLKMLTGDDLADVQEAVVRSSTTAESGSVKYLKSCLYNAPLNTRYSKIITGGAT